MAVIGKSDNEWKCWSLDDTARIELPLDKAHNESFPIGVCIDVSSTVPVKIGTWLSELDTSSLCCADACSFR